MQQSRLSYFSTRNEDEVGDETSQAASSHHSSSPEDNIPPEEFQKMKDSLKKFAQCMGLGKYAAAQLILNEHREDIQKWFGDDHPANLSVDNN